MKNNPHKRFLKARQLPEEIDPPPALAGISGEATLEPGVVSTGAFAFDASATLDTVSQSAPPLAGTFIPQVTTLPASTITSQVSPTPSVSVTGASHTIPLSTVVGACVGAFAGACLIILGSVMFYRKSTRSMSAKHRRPHHHKETWNQLDDEDKWDGGMTELSQGHATLSRSPTEKLGVFKKSPSMRTTRTDKSDVPSFESQTFAPYHSNLALELAGATTLDTAATQSNTRDGSQALSWRGSLLQSLRSDRAATGAISPSLNKAIPTPLAVTSLDSHHWQSAEVVNMDGSSVSVQEGKLENSPVTEDPFFDPKDQEYMARAREHSKGKRKEGNPFGDDAQPDTLAPASHPDSALQSIIAALGVASPTPMSPSPNSPSVAGGPDGSVTPRVH